MPTPPRVLVVRSELLARSERFIRSQAESLRRYAPFYFGCRSNPAEAPPPDRSLVLNRGGALGRAAELWFKWSASLPGLAERLTRIRPALIHAHFGPDGTLMLPLAGRLGVPLVTTFHGFDATMEDRYACRSFYSHRRYLRHRTDLQRQGGRFLAVSEFVRGHLIRQGFPPERTTVHYVGVDLKAFRPGSAPRRPVVLFVGRLSPEKGVVHVIRAMAEVARVCPDAELVVLGDGPLRRPLETMANALLPRVQFLGAVAEADVIGWMQAASVLCAPSVRLPSGEAEGFGLVFAEAQAAGLPVVAFRVGGIGEAVGDGDSGFLVPEQDEAALATHLIRLLGDRAMVNAMGLAGRRRAERLFDLERQTGRLEDLYDDLLRPRAGSPGGG